jgi:hypothetical protein
LAQKFVGRLRFDREIGTIDFLTLLDLRVLPAIIRALFLR